MKTPLFAVSFLALLTLSFPFSAKGLCQAADQNQPAAEKPADITPEEWATGGTLYFIGRPFLVTNAHDPQAERLILKTRTGFQILLVGGIEDELKQQLKELGTKEINLCVYAFRQKVNLSTFNYLYNKKGTLDKVTKDVLNADMWGIPLFIFQALEPMPIDPPGYETQAITLDDRDFLANLKSKSTKVTGKFAGVIKKSSFQTVKPLTPSITVGTDTTVSVQAEDMVFIVPAETRISRKTTANTLINLAPSALKTGTKVEVWYEVSGYKRIAQLIFISE